MPASAPKLPALLVLATLSACGDDRAMLTLPASAGLAPVPLSPAEGVTLRLSAARLSLADLTIEAPLAKTASFTPPSLISSAWAHPGHDAAGETTCALSGVWTVDLLGPELPLGALRCFEGPTAAAHLRVSPSPPALIEGVAELDGGEVPFRFTLAPDQAITGLPFVTELRAEAPPAGALLTVDLAHALSFVDWRSPDEDGDGLLTEADGATANTAAFGLLATPTYALTLVE